MDLLARRWKEIAEKPKTGLPLKGQSEINEGWDVHSDRLVLEDHAFRGASGPL